MGGWLARMLFAGSGLESGEDGICHRLLKANAAALARRRPLRPARVCIITIKRLPREWFLKASVGGRNCQKSERRRGRTRSAYIQLHTEFLCQQPHKGVQTSFSFCQAEIRA